MPYINKQDRTTYEQEISSIVNKLLKTEENAQKGHMNYIFYSIISRIVKERGERYFRWQDAIGTLECCKIEIYRRLISAYEDKAIEKNGDV